MKSIPKRVKRLREKMGVSIFDAAKACGVTPDSYEKFETGEALISTMDLSRLELFCRMRITDL